MDPLTFLVLLLGGLFLVLFAGLPIYVGFFLCNLAAVWFLMGPAGFGMFANSIFDSVTKTSLATIPLFILMGDLLFRASAVDVLFKSVDVLVGRVKGRQYVLTILISGILSALSGSAMAVGAMLGRTLLPLMRERGYNSRLAVGTILAGACLAPIVPPSILAIVAGTLAQVSIAALLLAGIVPGLMLVVAFVIYIFFRIGVDPSLAPAEGERTVSSSEVIKGLLNLMPFTLVIVSVMGSMLLGIATPGEAAAVGVVGAVLVAVILGRFSVKMFYAGLASTASISTMILIIMASSTIFSQILAFTGVAGLITEIVEGTALGYYGTLFVLMLIAFFLCMFMDQVAVMLILIPIYHPIIGILGYPDVWFWLLFLINITVGAITPPFGYVLFSVKAVAPEVTMTEIFRASLPFVFIYLLVMLIIALLPDLALPFSA